MHHSLLQIKLFASRHHAQRVVEGIAANATTPTIEIGPLKLHRTHQGFHGAADALLSPQHPITPGAVDLGAVVLTTMDMRHNRLRDAASELLAQVPHRGGY